MILVTVINDHEVIIIHNTTKPIDSAVQEMADTTGLVLGVPLCVLTLCLVIGITAICIGQR